MGFLTASATALMEIISFFVATVCDQISLKRKAPRILDSVLSRKRVSITVIRRYTSQLFSHAELLVISLLAYSYQELRGHYVFYYFHSLG